MPKDIIYLKIHWIKLYKIKFIYCTHSPYCADCIRNFSSILFKLLRDERINFYLYVMYLFFFILSLDVPYLSQYIIYNGYKNKYINKCKYINHREFGTCLLI